MYPDGKNTPGREAVCTGMYIWVVLFEKVHARSGNSCKRSPEINVNPFGSDSLILCKHLMLHLPFPKER